jgi:hypothetical protein
MDWEMGIDDVPFTIVFNYVKIYVDCKHIKCLQCSKSGVMQQIFPAFDTFRIAQTDYTNLF